jgi:hypothetical protein
MCAFLVFIHLRRIRQQVRVRSKLWSKSETASRA